MSLLAGKQLGPYEIVSIIGAGGMGEVYRARDTRLDRVVAIKILPSHLADSPAFRQRFEREARAISGLSHSSICALYDVGRQDNIDYLVMEFLEGETLAHRLEKGALPTDTLLRYATEIVSALDNAHRHGVVHRDLKPGNIMLTKSGAKLLDFGLARFESTPQQEVISRASVVATEAQKHLTAEGSIVGTVQYMAPEQLEGKMIDSRTDIFALGTVLYEMATGKKAFTGTSQAGLIASILSTTPPPISSVQPLAPVALDRVVKTCLEKDPDDRWQTAHDILLQLKWIAEGGTQPSSIGPVISRKRTKELLGWIVAAALLLITVLSFLYSRKTPESTRLMRLAVTTPSETGLVYPVISPDGQKLVLNLYDSKGNQRLWLRFLDSENETILPETDGAYQPFWSPDSRRIGFFADGKVKTIEATGGRPRVICEANNPGGGSWNKEDVILFGSTTNSPDSVIYRVSATGGKATPVSKLGPHDEAHRWPQFLPDGKHFVFLADSYQTKEHYLRVGSLDSFEAVNLLDSFISNAVFAQGYLLFSRQGVLMAQRLDTEKLALTGEPVSLVEKVAESNIGNHHFAFSVSENGILTYRKGNPDSQLIWFDRSGQRLGTVGDPGRVVNVELSPDGKSVAVERVDADGRNGDIWIVEFARDISNRVTHDPNWDMNSIWSPDGTKIAFASDRNVTGAYADLYLTDRATGAEDVLLLKSPVGKYPTNWSPDGKTIVFDSDYSREGNSDILLFHISDNKVTPFLHSSFNEFDGQVSPDGRWIAYVSDETGKPEIYVQSFPNRGEKTQISTNSGIEPRWRRDGAEIFYIAGDDRIWAADIKTDPGLQPGLPRPLFAVKLKLFASRHDYDVSADGQRFLVNTATESKDSQQALIVFNWQSLLNVP